MWIGQIIQLPINIGLVSMVTQGMLAFFFHDIGCQGYNKLLQNTAVTSPDHSGIVLHLAITCSKSHLIQHLNPEGTLGSILLWVNQVNKFDIKGENAHRSYQTYKVYETGIATLPEIKHLNISGKRWESADANYIILKYNPNPNQWKLNQSRTSSTFRANITFPTAIMLDNSYLLKRITTICKCLLHYVNGQNETKRPLNTVRDKKVVCSARFVFSTRKTLKIIQCGYLYVLVSELQVEYTADINEVCSENEPLMIYIRLDVKIDVIWL